MNLRRASRGIGTAVAYLMVAAIIILASVLAVSYQIENSNIARLNAQTSSDSSTINSLNDKVSALQATLSSANSQLSALSTQLSSANSMNLQLQSQLSALQSQLTQANSQISALGGEVNNLQSIIQLKNESTWVSQKGIRIGPNSCSSYLISGNTAYAGYLELAVVSSTAPYTVLSVKWNAFGINYSQSASVGSVGTALFVILPASSVTYQFCNNSYFVTDDLTVTVVYHY